MLQTRSAVPLLSSSSPQQWQLHALLRLPPELRQIAFRTFTSSATLHTSNGDDGGGGDESLSIRRTHQSSHPQFRRLLVWPSTTAKGRRRGGRASEGQTSDVKEHGSSSSVAEIPMAQPFYRSMADQSSTRSASQELSIRAVAIRTWGADPEMDDLVRSLDATTDRATRQSLRAKMSRLQRQRQASMAGYSASSAYNWSSLSKPFEQQHDPNEGFADAVVGSSARASHGSMFTAKRLSKPVFTPAAGLTLYKLLDIRKGLDPEKDKVELEKIDAQLKRLKRSLQEAGEELHQYRSPAELEKFNRVARDLSKGVTKEERIALKAERQRLNAAADRRRVASDRDKQLEAKMREEIFSKTPPTMIVLPNGGVSTKEEQDAIERLETTIESHQRSAHPDPDYIGQLKRKQFVLQRNAHLRGALLRGDPHTARMRQHAIPIRLAQLKKTLMKSPENVSGAPEIKAQLKELEDALRHSLKAALPTPSPKVSQRAITEAALAQLAINFERLKEKGSGTPKSTEIGTRLEDVQHPDKEAAVLSAALGSIAVPEPSPVPSPAPSPEPSPKPSPPEATAETAPNNVAPRPEDLSIFTELRGQMQELNSLLKLLVSQQAAAQGSTTATGALSQVVEKANGTVNAMARVGATHPSQMGHETAGRYKSLNKSSADDTGTVNNFFDLPHEAVPEAEPASQEEQPQGLAQSQEVTPATVKQPSSPANMNPAISEAAVESASGLEELSSLYEQLFPEEAAPSQAGDETRAPVPRLSLPQDSAKVTQDRSIGTSEALAAPTDMEVEHWKSVLILSGASKTLTEDDFRRAIPRGKHFQEWTKSAYERVIPVRDFWTLEPTGDYYIVFNHHKRADAFLAHVKRVFNMTKSHTPTSLLSELPPAPSGLLRDGADDEAELVRNFTLATPSMSLNLQRADKGIKAEVLKRGAYPQVLAGNLTPETPQVVLDLDGGVMPNWFQIRDAIARDGLRRSLPWNLISGDLAIRRLAMERPTSQADLEADYESSLGDAANELVARDSLAETDNGYDSDATLLARERLERGEQGQRWVVAFREREEAQRFARQWHMRAFPWTEAEFRVHRTYQNRTRMKVEMLW